MSYWIDNESFRTKDEVLARCRSILAATRDGEPIDEGAAPFLFALFQFHEEWPQKAEGGIKHISTQTTPHGTRCFVLVNGNGGCIDISFPHAVRLIPSPRSTALIPQALRDFRNAARMAIRAQIFEFRDSALRLDQRCPFTGEVLSPATCAVDHAPPNTFDQLLYDFCRSHSLDPLQVAVGSENGTVAVIEDTGLVVAWQAYHRKNAHLRLLSQMGNLQLCKVAVPWGDLLS